ncbi:hypothetical protein GOBAR_DD21448 [Gossypium barbadense]|nr:hypothetical protein GOBAR_DD21448 [Gossypium barbadense]
MRVVGVMEQLGFLRASGLIHVHCTSCWYQRSIRRRMRKQDETGSPVWGVGSLKEQEEKKKGVKKVEMWKWLNESPLTRAPKFISWVTL